MIAIADKRCPEQESCSHDEDGGDPDEFHQEQSQYRSDESPNPSHGDVDTLIHGCIFSSRKIDRTHIPGDIDGCHGNAKDQVCHKDNRHGKDMILQQLRRQQDQDRIQKEDAKGDGDKAERV